MRRAIRTTAVGHSLSCTIAGLLAAGAAPTLADDATTALETVTVYARRDTPITEVAATVTVVDQARIEALQAGDVQELVRYEPGLVVRNDPFRFGLDTISIRGLGGNRVAVEVDGIPAAGGFAVGSHGDTGRAFVDPAFLQRVEFLRGPASSLYGSDAIGGIVAMTTLAPADVLRDGGQRVAVRTAAGYTGDDAGWHASALAAGELGSGEWLLGYVRRTGHEVETATDEVEPDPRDYTSDAVLAKYVMPGLGGGALTLTFEGNEVRQTTSVDAFLGVGRFPNTILLEGDDRLVRQRLGVQQAFDAAGWWFDSADARLYWQATRTDQDTYEVRRAVPPRTPAVEIDRSFKFDESTLGFEFVARQGFDTARTTHALVYGVEATRSKLEELREGAQTSLATGDVTHTIAGEVFPMRDLPLSDVTEIGVFAQDDIRLGATGWSLAPGLRLDYYRLDPTADRIYREDNPTHAPVGVENLSFAPKLGVTWRVTEAVSAFAQYARGFRSPPPEDVNIGLDFPLFKVRALPNPDLDPESSDGYEVGVRVTGGAVGLTASAFRTDYDEFIESKVNLGIDPVTGYTLFQSRNVAEARIEGFEMTATLEAGELVSSLRGWSARLAGSWTRGEDRTRDQPLNSIDPPRAVLGARYESATQLWATELVLTAVEAKTDVAPAQPEAYRTDGYATLDLLGQWRVTERLRLDVGLFNLTDTEYVEWADVRGRANDDPLVPYYTRPGFNASATLRYDF